VTVQGEENLPSTFVGLFSGALSASAEIKRPPISLCGPVKLIDLFFK
jgi:hypothetical protein